jgi:hypothetical protein
LRYSILPLVNPFVSEDMEYYYSSGGGSDDDQYQFLNYEGVTSESKSTTEFRVITAQEIREDQQRLIEDIASCLAMPVSSAGVLLRYFRCAIFSESNLESSLSSKLQVEQRKVVRSILWRSGWCKKECWCAGFLGIYILYSGLICVALVSWRQRWGGFRYD